MQANLLSPVRLSVTTAGCSTILEGGSPSHYPRQAPSACDLSTQTCEEISFDAVRDGSASFWADLSHQLLLCEGGMLL